MYFPKWHLTKTQVSPVSKPCILLNFSSILAVLLSKPPGAGDHLASGFLDAETKVPMLMEILWLHAFKHALGAWFTKLSYRLASGQGVYPQFLSLGRKQLERGKPGIWRSCINCSQNVTSWYVRPALGLSVAKASGSFPGPDLDLWFLSPVF